jgi:NAD(P)-dependent dehydrogenase (short-subunit alcohol dehydrogenase family)
MRLAQKVIIVTGSTSGIGKAIAARAVAEGARVLVHGIERSDGEKLVASLGARAALHLDDLADPASPPRIVAAALAAFGRIDGVVNNAAIVARSTLESTTPAFFERMMAVNVRAPLFLIQAALPQLKANHGAVLNIGSINAHSGQANLLDYSVSK